MFATPIFRVYQPRKANLCWAALLAVLLSWFLLFAAPSQADTKKVYVFGNSLIHHSLESEKTTVPYWLGHFAKRQGKDLQLDGQSGFLRNYVDDLPPTANWWFSNVKPAWNRTFRRFEDVGYSHIMMNPTNFVQYQSADQRYDRNDPDSPSPLSVSVDLLDQVARQKEVLLYEGWADLAAFSSRFPPRKRPLRKYHAYNIGDYHDWYVDYVNALQAQLPHSKITLVPVARILSRAFTETSLRELEATDIYIDDAPHGTISLYFLAAIPVYAQLFGELPDVGDVAPEVHPLIKTHFAEFLQIVVEEMPSLAQRVSETRSAADVTTASASSPAASASDAPALGYGLNGIADWSTQVPFVNVMKMSRQWTGHLKGRDWGGWGEEELQSGGHLDPHGWPIRVPVELTKIEALMLTDFPEDAVQHAGTYRLTWEGEGKVDLAGRPRALRYGEKEIWFRFSPGDGSLGVAIHESDPNGTGDYIRNIAVVREDQIPLFEAGVVFNPEWLRHVKEARALRFMDWMFTNGSEVETWDQRPVTEDYTYVRRGVPMEQMVDLVNQIGADPWFNMPHKADDAYIRAFAQYVHDNLRPGLKAHLEYSNEVWNFLFQQAHYAAAEANALWGDRAEGDGWMQFYGHRSAQMATIWSEIFAEDMSRLVRVFGVHTGWAGLEEGALNAPLSVLQGGPRPADLFDAYAVTGYFGLEFSAEGFEETILKWIAEGETSGQGYQLPIERLGARVKDKGLITLTQEYWPYHAKVAADHDMQLMMYEGGTHIIGREAWVHDDTLTAFLNAFNYSPEMADIYQDLLAAWDAAGGTFFNAFVDVSKPSQWGSWGALRHLGDSNPRADVLTAYNAAGAQWASDRGADAFEAGDILFGIDGADILSGTQYPDVLIGGAGDDEFYPDAGKNHVHGGAGNDHVVLPGFLEEYRFAAEGPRLVASSDLGVTRLVAVETLSFSETPELILSTSDLF